jgi:ATP-dependent helicase HrpB
MNPIKTTTAPLPIDAVLPELQQALAQREAVVLQAPPGAGKTTRVPLALLAEAWLAGRRILMLEPRRLAAANAARYMAACLGEEVGQTVGYAIRFERRVSRTTRIEVVTEGILTRRLQADPLLQGVGLVIFDEFHERHLHTDLALALCRDAQLGLREDLRILVMSATLDAGPVARLLGDAPLVTSAGRNYPVEISYLGAPTRLTVEAFTAAAVRRALAETAGDILVFLPGAAEIRRCAAQLSAAASMAGVRLCPLYGDLPFAEQELAILPGDRRKVVLATNIAETSLTIEGVSLVIDSGLARRPRFNAAAGMSRLETVRISQASADQRAGRAGRLAPGSCYRLWGDGEQGALLPFTSPEIRTADLAPLVLELARWGEGNAGNLTWLDPPSEGMLAGAGLFLQSLGALDAGGRITAMGEEMARLPAHPRLARLLVATRQQGEAALGCDLAALLSERDLFRRDQRPDHGTDSDLLDRLEMLHSFRRRKIFPHEVDRAACAAVDRASRHFAGAVGADAGTCQERGRAADGIARLLAPAFPDRLAMEREPGSGRYLLAGGQGARLSPRSGVRKAPLLIALEVEGEVGGEARINLATVLPVGIVEEVFADQLGWRREVAWDDREEKVVAREVRRLGALSLASRSVAATDEEAAAAVLDGVRRLGLDALGWSGASRQLAARVRLLARIFPGEGWPDFSPAHLEATAPEWLGPFLAGVRNRADLARLDPLPALTARLDWQQSRRLDEAAPGNLLVPSGHRIPLDYDAPEPPVMAVKLQELFGLAATPCIADGRVPVLLQLLSPARRPIQTTRDLLSFWNRIYPEVKKELKGRYPKHPWPDDPWRAEATRKTKR